MCLPRRALISRSRLPAPSRACRLRAGRCVLRAASWRYVWYFFFSLLTQVGMGNPDVQVPITHLIVKEIALLGSFRYAAGDYDIAIQLAASGKVDVTRLVTHRYVFQDADKAFQATTRGKGEDGQACIKVQICQGAAGSPP